MRITIVGSGYVGLVAGACFAESGNEVVCLDVDSKKIDALKQGVIPIYEPGLESMIKENVKAARLSFTTDKKAALRNAEVIFIAVGTPMGEDGSADLQYVKAVARDIGENIESKYVVVVDKSTVPVGTARIVKGIIESKLKARNCKANFDVVSNPEFLKEGVAIKDFLSPDRVVIGCDSQKALEVMKALYSPFLIKSDRLIAMNIESAEMTKYAANAMLATKISFINEMAQICERVGANINDVRLGIGSDSRIGYSFIYPGCGYGGSCFPKDVRALEKTALDYGYKARILHAVQGVNESQKLLLVEKILRHFCGLDYCHAEQNSPRHAERSEASFLESKLDSIIESKPLKNKTFAVWGLSFKPETDDMREASAIVLIAHLVRAGARVNAYDSKAQHQAKYYLKEYLDSINLVDSKYDALKNADALCLVTEWREFRSPDFDEIAKLLKSPVIFDGRNIYQHQNLESKGFTYYQIGVGNHTKCETNPKNTKT